MYDSFFFLSSCVIYSTRVFIFIFFQCGAYNFIFIFSLVLRMQLFVYIYNISSSVFCLRSMYFFFVCIYKILKNTLDCLRFASPNVFESRSLLCYCYFDFTHRLILISYLLFCIIRLSFFVVVCFKSLK